MCPPAPARPARQLQYGAECDIGANKAAASSVVRVAIRSSAPPWSRSAPWWRRVQYLRLVSCLFTSISAPIHRPERNARYVDS